jgi:hypothetical protein
MPSGLFGLLPRATLMNIKGSIQIVFTWAMEIVGVASGIINSTYTTFGGNLPIVLSGTFRLYL